VTERELLDATYEATRDRATLVITHRLVRMEEMDEILVLGEGRVAERGTHEELLDARGLYRHMVEVQRDVFVTS
jgi:ABC-type multidrug transport system fused ATPase/permease subunit